MAEPQVFGCFSIGSVVETYEEIYVPRIFIPWAKLLIDRAQLRAGESVLDVATGPGTVARLAAEQVGSSGRVVGTDISPAMIAVAQQKPGLPSTAPIEYVVAPAAPLPVADASFDVALCQQGLQFFPDCPAALREMHRALKPGGRLGAAVWKEIAFQPSFADMDAALRECLPPDQAQPYGSPFRGANGDQLKKLVAEAGFSKVRVEEYRLPLIYDGGISQVVATLAASPVATTIAELDEPTRTRLLAAAGERLKALVKDGEVRTEMVSNIVTAERR
jgi:SAM-dependent methyltransferase